MIQTRPAGQANDITQLRTKSKDRIKRNSDDTSPVSLKKMKNMVNQETEISGKERSPHKKEHADKSAEKPLRRSPRKKENGDKDMMEIKKIVSPAKKRHIEINESDTENKKEINEAKNVQIKIDSLHDVRFNLMQ